ncbi:MAG: AI-2E family transporter YdiK [Nitrospirae bacterium]|nr:AI-2E family transporter YdiK [Nitrospirota bacterium]NTW66599.1 AI-2E family transporter YdiK [Nitrospirota bacterium]
MKERNLGPLDITHTTLSVLFIAILIASTFWVMRPFLMSLIWASVIVVATWPAFEGFERRLGGRRGLAVAAMAVLILLVILVPITFAVATILGNVDNISAHVSSLSSLSLSAPPDWISSIPVAGARIAGRWREFAALSTEERTTVMLPYARTAMQWFMAQAGSIGMTIVQFLLTVIISMILYAKGTVVREGVLNFARRLAGRRGEEAAILAGKAVRGVVLGVVVTALIQAAIGGVGLFVAGVPAAGLLTAVIVLFCLAQVGPFLVMIPAVIWLYWSGQPGRGTVLLVFLIVAGTIDNFVRPFLIRKGADLPLLLIFAGVIGGLIAFGIIGLFIGPVMLAVTYTLLKEWVAGDTLDEGGRSAAG